MILLMQFRKFVNTFFLMVVFTSVASCGGGSGGGGGGSDVTSSSSSGTVQSPPQSLAELRIPRENELSAVTELSVEVQINTSKSYLSICDIPGEELDVNKVNYEKCILRTPIDNNFNTFKLALPNHIDSLVAIVWFYEASRQPLVQRWHRVDAAGLPIDTIWRVHE